MIRRFAAFVLLTWLFGFLWFAFALPRPRDGGRTDAVVVLTGGAGRIERGLQMVYADQAKRMLVSGVDREVKPREFAAEYRVSAAVMECCVSLGYESYDTRSNAAETARWLESNRFRSVRLVTTDWHMRRAALELERLLPSGIEVTTDAVVSSPSLRILFLEYNKYLARRLTRLWEG